MKNQHDIQYNYHCKKSKQLLIRGLETEVVVKPSLSGCIDEALLAPYRMLCAFFISSRLIFSIRSSANDGYFFSELFDVFVENRCVRELYHSKDFTSSSAVYVLCSFDDISLASLAAASISFKIASFFEEVEEATFIFATFTSGSERRYFISTLPDNVDVFNVI